ncbi:hypothetical protein FACS1894122_09530 [Alphaproteobacteria bacterium]|nr:hypothetical protein FACS1894122_09530 [Alphaproteobacteria bacterium]
MNNLINKMAQCLLAIGALLSFSAADVSGRAAGVLTWAIDPTDNVPKVLLGHRNYGNRTWANMGGKQDKKDKNHDSVTAAREVTEETLGLYNYRSNELFKSAALFREKNYSLYMPQKSSKYISADLMNTWMKKQRNQRYVKVGNHTEHQIRDAYYDAKKKTLVANKHKHNDNGWHKKEHSEFKWVPMIDLYKLAIGKKANLGKVRLMNYFLRSILRGNDGKKRNKVRDAMKCVLKQYKQI